MNELNTAIENYIQALNNNSPDAAEAEREVIKALAKTLIYEEQNQENIEERRNTRAILKNLGIRYNRGETLKGLVFYAIVSRTTLCFASHRFTYQLKDTIKYIAGMLPELELIFLERDDLLPKSTKSEREDGFGYDS